MIERILLHVGQPYYPWAEVRVPAGQWRLQRARDAGFQHIEYEVRGAGPTIVDDGAAALGIPLDGQLHYYRLVRADGVASPVTPVQFPHWTAYTPHMSPPRQSGTLHRVLPVRGVDAHLMPRAVYREGQQDLWKLYGSRLCHRGLLPGLDLGELATDIYSWVLPPEERQRLDAASYSRFPGMGYSGQLLEWLLESAYHMSHTDPGIIVGEQSPLYGKRLGPREARQLVRMGTWSHTGTPYQFEHWLRRTPLRVRLEWSGARLHPDSYEPPAIQYDKGVRIANHHMATTLVAQNPVAITYRPANPREVRPGIIGRVESVPLDYRRTDDVLHAILGAGDACAALDESSGQLIQRVSNAAYQRLQQQRELRKKALALQASRKQTPVAGPRGIGRAALGPWR